MLTDAPRLHPLHRAWQSLPARTRRLWLARGSAWLAPSPDRTPPTHANGVIIGGEIGRASGLGESARLMAAALRTLGVPGGAIEAGPGIRAGRALRDWPDRSALVLHVNAPVLPAALIGLGRRALRGRRVVGFWAWELPTVPAHWRPALRLVHDVWAPSRFTADALRTLGLDHVRVVPHPVAAAPPVPSALDRQAFGLDPDAVVTLCSFSLASSFERKNPLAAIEAHRTAFADRPDRILVLKAGHGEHYPDDLARLRNAIGDAPNIRLETRTLPAADMHALTRSCDIVLSLHRSEGFGLVPAEAMLLGKPVIATNWSATTEFLDESCGVPIRYRLIPARDPRGVFEAPGAVWADADIADAAQALRTLADAPERRAAIGDAARRVATARLGTAGLEAALAAIGVPTSGTRV